MEHTDLLTLNETPYVAESLLLGPRPERSDLAFIAKATFDLVPGGVATPAAEQLPLAGGDVQDEPDPDGVVRYESDLVPFKPVADVLCVGNAHAPLARAVPECRVRFGVGSFSKEIRVVGDRTWSAGLLGFGHRKSRPEPFTSLPVSFENAYGGRNLGRPEGSRDYDRNRLGKGYSRFGFGVAGAALPNLEDPRRPIRSWRSRRTPMGFGPVGRSWQPRCKLAGRYDKRFLKGEGPDLPEDFDERFYNCAPEDQQVAGYLHGDETLRVDHMHPKHAKLECQLPGVRPRCFVDRSSADGLALHEVPMALDTLWVDMETLRLVLVWRGRMRPGDLEGSTAFLLDEEPLDAAPLPAEHYLPTFESALEEASDAWADAELAEAERAFEEVARANASGDAEPTS